MIGVNLEGREKEMIQKLLLLEKRDYLMNNRKGREGWRVVGWGVVRHDFFEPISYGFFFHLVCQVTQANGSKVAKSL